MKESDCYIVLGQARTGTSLTMGTLIALGVHSGGSMRKGPMDHEYYEQQELLDYLDGKQTADQVLQLIHGGKPKWGFKIPRPTHPKSRLLVEHVCTLPNVSTYFVVTHRPVEGVYQSWQRAVRKIAYHELVAQTEDIYKWVNKVVEDKPQLHIDFDKWFNNLEEVLSYLALFTFLPINKKARDLTDPSKRHFK